MMTDQATSVPVGPAPPHLVGGARRGQPAGARPDRSCPAEPASSGVAVAYLLVVGAGEDAFVVRVLQQRRDAEQLCAAYASEPWDDPAAGPRVVACPLDPVPAPAAVPSPAVLATVAGLTEQRAGMWELLKRQQRQLAGLRAELDAATVRADEFEQLYAAAAGELFERTGVLR